MTDSQRSRIDGMKGEKPATIAKTLGITKEYVDDYLKSFTEEKALAASS